MFVFTNDNNNDNMITMMTIPITITITTTAQDCRMLKGITMMIIVLLMKACIESSLDNFFVFFLFWITTEGLSFVNNINNNYYYTYIYIYILLRVVSLLYGLVSST